MALSASATIQDALDFFNEGARLCKSHLPHEPLEKIIVTGDFASRARQVVRPLLISHASSRSELPIEDRDGGLGECEFFTRAQRLEPYLTTETCTAGVGHRVAKQTEERRDEPLSDPASSPGHNGAVLNPADNLADKQASKPIELSDAIKELVEESPEAFWAKTFINADNLHKNFYEKAVGLQNQSVECALLWRFYALAAYMAYKATRDGKLITTDSIKPLGLTISPEDAVSLIRGGKGIYDVCITAMRPASNGAPSITLETETKEERLGFAFVLLADEQCTFWHRKQRKRDREALIRKFRASQFQDWAKTSHYGPAVCQLIDYQTERLYALHSGEATTCGRPTKRNQGMEGSHVTSKRQRVQGGSTSNSEGLQVEMPQPQPASTELSCNSPATCWGQEAMNFPGLATVMNVEMAQAGGLRDDAYVASPRTMNGPNIDFCSNIDSADWGNDEIGTLLGGTGVSDSDVNSGICEQVYWSTDRLPGIATLPFDTMSC